MNEEWNDFLKGVNPLKKNHKIKKNFKVEPYEDKLKDTLENITQDEKFFNEDLKNYDLENRGISVGVTQTLDSIEKKFFLGSTTKISKNNYQNYLFGMFLSIDPRGSNGPSGRV